MFPESTAQSRHDLRSNAVDQKRYESKKAKWTPRWADVYGPPAVIGNGGKLRPRVQMHTMRCAHQDRRVNAKDDRRLKAHRKQEPFADQSDGYYGSSPDDDCASPASSSPGNQETEDFKYSYDARTGPSEGREVLGVALTKAVEKYEDRQTTKLVKDEYEVLEGDGAESDAEQDDDGFELV